MGLIRGIVFDTTVLVASERRRESVEELIERLQSVHGEIETAISTVSIVELTHGLQRARTNADRDRRALFIEEICLSMSVYPLSLELAQLAGRIEGQQAPEGLPSPLKTLSSAAPRSISTSAWPP